MSRLSIRLKFAVALALIAGLFATAIFWAWRIPSQVEADVRALYDGPLWLVDVGRGTERDFMDLRRHYLAAATMPQPKWIRRYGELRGKVAADLDALAPLAGDAEGDLSRHLAGATSQFAEWESLLARGDFSAYRSQIDRAADSFQSDIDAIIDTAEHSAKDRTDKVGERVRAGRSAIMAGGAAAAAAGLLIMLVLARHIVRPLEQAARIAEGVADGRLPDQAPPGRSDELGQLLRVLSAMARKMLSQQYELEARNAELELLAATDKLTGLVNRRKLEEVAAAHLARIRRYGGELSAVLLDIDHFKEVNDRHGHSVGDIVIAHIAALIGQAVRETDLAGRWGGEEFLILLPGTSLDGAEILAEKVRLAVAGHDFPVAGRKTASFGVGQLLEDESIGDLFDRIDRALYRAKQEGRNLVRLDRGTATVVPLPLIRSTGGGNDLG